MKKQIPNLITLGNLLCGVIACVHAVTGHLVISASFVCLGIFLDFFDGMAARLLKVTSPIGKELDSLADVVTSGVAPGFIFINLTMANTDASWPSLAGLLIPLFAAYRLAKFNVDTRQSHSFRGLPVPANALIWVGLCPYSANADLFSPAFIVALVVLSLITDVLMVSEMPMFSLKFNFKDMSWRTNKVQYIFLIGCVVAIVATEFEWYALSIIIIWYIILSALTQHKTDEH